jgi:hypothetical protein
LFLRPGAATITAVCGWSEIFMLKTLLALTALMTVVGCCQCPKADTRAMPAPLSLAEQVNRLNDRAHALAKLTVGGTVVIRYHDPDKGDQQQTAEGRLLLQQHFDEPGRGGDVFLSGRAFNQEVFRAGTNDKQWFFIIYLDPKRAWIGPVDSESRAAGGGGAVMRADTVLEVLGITELPSHGCTVGMLVRDQNQLLELRTQGSSPAAWVKREILVNRRTGDIDRVNLYDPNGILLVKADLKDYREVKYRDGDEAPEGFKPPRFPSDIYIEYVTQKASIHFTVPNEYGKRAELRERLPSQAFDVPPPEQLEGFKIEHAH